MTPEDVQHMFTPFFRAHPDRDSELQVEGLGLGLAIVRDCVEAIGVSIHVDSAPGVGTTFRVRMPFGTGSH